jgi:F-type H+-transporting ATPase subunit b
MIRFLVAPARALPVLAMLVLLSGGAAAAQKGMPQLHVPDFTPQLFWLAVWFVILYVLMTKVGLPRIVVAIDARRQRRDDDLARATQLKSEAEAASAAFQRTMSEARAEAQAVLKQTSDRLAAEAAERQRALAATLAEQIAAAERRIAESKQQALTEVRGIAVDVGRSVVEKLTGSPPDAARLAAAVDRRMAEPAPGIAPGQAR